MKLIFSILLCLRTRVFTEEKSTILKPTAVYKLTLLLCSGVLLASCGSSRPAPVDARDLDPFSDESLCAWHLGDPDVGRELFEQRVLAGSAGCITCHSLEPDVWLVGPSLHGIALTAMERQEGVIAPNYLYLSIIIPEHYVVEGYTSGLMPASYATELREEEIADLVSYLMTLYP